MDIVTPINIASLRKLLLQSDYNFDKTKMLLDGFTRGFDIGYRGPTNRKHTSNNLPLRVGSKTELWNKVMKEVKECRYAGSFDRPPCKHYVQSPLGLVPKAGGKTRLIFHLSYDFGAEDKDKSVNFHTPKNLCSVKYNDLEHAIRASLELLKIANIDQKIIFYGKTDSSNAFRLVPVLVMQHAVLVMMAVHPRTNKCYYFVDKCLPFGSS